MFNFLSAHAFWTGVVGFWVASALVGGMPDPDATSGKGYKWLFSSAHILVGNLTSAFGSKIPGAK